MKILYTRCSTIGQNSERQKLDQTSFDILIEDKVSGSISFSEREGGKKIITLLKEKKVTSLTVHSIDRLGRDLKDILQTIDLFNEHGTAIIFKSQGLTTINDKGEINPITKMIISILGTIAEMNRNQILENQRQGIEIAKALGRFNGRKKGTVEDTHTFLSKPKNKKALELIKKGYKNVEIASITKLHPNTITKIKKVGLR